MKSNLFFRLFLVLFSFLAFSGEAAAQTACTTIPAPQFAQSTNTSTVMNGVTVTRTLSRALYSPVTTNTTQTPQCTASLAAGYAWLRAEDVNSYQTVTYTFSQPQTSVQVFLLLMGNAGQPNSADRADFSVNNGTISISKNPNDNSIDCLGKITISSNTVQVNNLANNTTNGAVSVSSTVPFTTLTVTNVRTNIYRSTVDGYGYFVEICPTSVKCVAPAVPAVSTQAATCSSAGTATITNYSAFNTYTFNPTGPTVGAGGVISGLAAGTSYTVSATVGTCTSANSTSFSVQAKLATPAITGTLTAPKNGTSQLTGSGTKATTNPWVSSNSAVATVTANGLVRGVSPGTSTITYTNNAGCTATATFTVTAVQSDWDGDGVADATDLDDDNDGILDPDEMYCNQNTNLVSSTTASHKGEFVFFNWGNSTLATGLTSTVDFKGVKYTAVISDVSTTGGTYVGSKLTDVTWPNAPTNILHKHYYETGKNEAFYQAPAVYNTGNKTYTVTITATRNGTALPYPVEVAVFDPEGTDPNETLSYTTNGTSFKIIETLGNDNNETTGAGSQTVTYIGDQKNNTYPIFSTTGNSIVLNVTMKTANSKQGSAFAIRAYCDTDGDAIPNFLDTDSDNDGCPDATEGANRYATTATLPGGSNGGSTANLGTTVNTSGIPNAAGTGQATTPGVNIPVRINAGTIPAATVTVNTGETVTLTSNATAETTSVWNTTTPFAPDYTTSGNATAGLTYSWTKNGATIQGATSATLTLNNVTPANEAGTYVVTIRHPNNYCGTTKQTVLTVNDVCYISPNTGTAVPSKHGITLLKRAGAGNGNWPMIRSSAHTVLEANAKGFVITRMTTVQITAITNPQEGMMVYDSDLNCLKLYDGTAWSCFSKPACP